MTTDKNELLCRECGWHGDEPLKADNPFSPGSIITACPDCLEIEQLRVVCEIDACTKEATCGTPTDDGYIRCCGEHYSALQA